MPPNRPSPELRARLDARAPLLVLTGAGCSAESGLATFRGPGGLWEGREPTTLATPEAFRAHPAEVWRFYAWRRAAAAAARPNPAHVVEINAERTPLTPDVDEHIAGPAGRVLPELARAAGVALSDESV